tara:strand:+ start:141 stop:1421 length:1281 start_codon:yes stop_codon:yes gene_type:complete
MQHIKKKFKKKIILIYGYGKSGSASYNYLKKNNKIYIFDDFKILKNLPFIKFKKINKISYDYILLSPGINISSCKLKKFLKKNRKKIITDLDIFYNFYPKNLKITITGTNGKSTTSLLLYKILLAHKKKVKLIGNIGKPMLSINKVSENTIFVIEASSYQIEYSQYFKTDYAIILNIAPDHLERHGNMQNYAKAKFKLINNQEKNTFSYVDNNNKYLKKELSKKKYKSKLKIVKYLDFKKIKNKIYNPYFHNLNNIQNLSFIFEIAKQLKLSNKKILKSANLFKGLNYRQQIIKKNKNLTIINDSKSTSFSSSLNLLKSYKNIIWILGGLSKKNDKFRLPSKYFGNIKCYIYGKDKNFFANILKGKINFQKFNTLNQVISKINLDIKIQEKVNIIFSPSAASFDQFENFEERGKYFNYLVQKKLFK